MRSQPRNWRGNQSKATSWELGACSYTVADVRNGSYRNRIVPATTVLLCTQLWEATRQASLLSTHRARKPSASERSAGDLGDENSSRTVTTQEPSTRQPVLTYFTCVLAKDGAISMTTTAMSVVVSVQLAVLLFTQSACLQCTVFVCFTILQGDECILCYTMLQVTKGAIANLSTRISQL